MAPSDRDSYRLEDPQQIELFRQVHGQLLQEKGEKTDGVSRMYILYQLKDGRQVKRYYSIDETTQAYDTLEAYFSRWQYIFNVDNWQEVQRSISSIDISFSKYITESMSPAQGEQAMDMEMAEMLKGIMPDDVNDLAPIFQMFDWNKERNTENGNNEAKTGMDEGSSGS